MAGNRKKGPRDFLATHHAWLAQVVALPCEWLQVTSGQTEYEAGLERQRVRRLVDTLRHYPLEPLYEAAMRGNFRFTVKEVDEKLDLGWGLYLRWTPGPEEFMALYQPVGQDRTANITLHNGTENVERLRKLR